jgi:hypothetical protein
MGVVMLVENSIWNALVPASIRNFTQKFVPSALVSFGLMMISAIPVERYFVQKLDRSGHVGHSRPSLSPCYLCLGPRVPIFHVAYANLGAISFVRATLAVPNPVVDLEAVHSAK